MHRIPLIVCAVCFALFAFPTKIGTKWVYAFQGKTGVTDSIAADTAIMGMRYQKVVRTGDWPGAYYLRASAEKVFVLDLDARAPQEVLLYDFGVGLSTSVPVLTSLRNLTTSEPLAFRALKPASISGDTIAFWADGHRVLWKKHIGQLFNRFDCLALGVCPEYDFLLTACVSDNDTLYRSVFLRTGLAQRPAAASGGAAGELPRITCRDGRLFLRTDKTQRVSLIAYRADGRKLFDVFVDRMPTAGTQETVLQESFVFPGAAIFRVKGTGTDRAVAVRGSHK